MTDPWSSTVSVLAGRAAAAPRQWPAARTRRVELCDNPVPGGATSEVTDAEREVLDALGDCAMSGGEIAYVLGISLESAYNRISRLHARGYVLRCGRLWERVARKA